MGSDKIRLETLRDLGCSLGMDDYLPAEEFTPEAIREHVNAMERRERACERARIAEALGMQTSGRGVPSIEDIVKHGRSR